MPPQRATLLQVAQRAGVSRSTASFVLAGRHQDMRISEDARLRVLRAAEELDYRPNLMARSLRTKVTRTIALVSDTIASDPYAGRAIHGSLAAAVAHGRLLFIGETEGDPLVEQRLISDLLDRQVDAFLYARMFTRHVRVPKLLQGHPVVLLNCLTRAARPAYHSVVPDEIAAGWSAARVVTEAGHRDGIHLVGNPVQHVFAGRERLAGIREGLAAADTRLAGTISCEWWPGSAYDAVSRALATGLEPSVLICLNDRIALGAYQALREAGKDIPADVSVVSFDDSELAAWLRPQLTSISLPHYQLGWQAVELLLGEPEEPRVVRVPMPVRHRASIAKPAV
jgi:LacI family transcriptional regulator